MGAYTIPSTKKRKKLSKDDNKENMGWVALIRRKGKKIFSIIQGDVSLTRTCGVNVAPLATPPTRHKAYFGYVRILASIY